MGTVARPTTVLSPLSRVQAYGNCFVRVRLRLPDSWLQPCRNAQLCTSDNDTCLRSLPLCFLPTVWYSVLPLRAP